MVVYLFNFNTCQDLALLEIGDQQCSPLYAFGPNIRNEYIFHYVVSGKGVVMLQPSGEKGQNILSETIEVKAGEGFLIEPHTAHMYRADENDPWHYIWIVFTGLSVPSYLRACGLTRNNPGFLPPKLGAWRYLPASGTASSDTPATPMPQKRSLSGNCIFSLTD